jgi:hypothetical protein
MDNFLVLAVSYPAYLNYFILFLLYSHQFDTYHVSVSYIVLVWIQGLFGAAMFPTTWCLFVSFGAAISKFKFPLVLHSNRENHLFEGLSSNLKFKLNE